MRCARHLYQQYKAGGGILARRLCAVLVGSVIGRAARGGALSRGGAQLSGKILDRARQPHRRGFAHAADWAQGGATDCRGTPECGRRHRRFRRSTGRHCRRYARGRARPHAARCQRVVRRAARNGRPGRDRAHDESCGHRQWRARRRAERRRPQRHDRRRRAHGTQSAAQRRFMLPPLPISTATAGSGASKASRRRARASRSAQPLPTRAHGCALCAALAMPLWRSKRRSSLPKRSRNCRG